MSSKNIKKNDFTWHHWLIVILLLIVTGIASRGLNADHYWADEVHTLERAGEPRYTILTSPLDVWTITTEVSDQVPAYYTALAGWTALVGYSEFGARAFSLVLGVLSIAWIFRLGTDLASPTVGISSAIVLSSSVFYLILLHELRAYAMVCCLTVMVIWLYWRIIQGHHGWLTQGGLVLASATMMYTHYAGFIIIFAICAYHLLVIEKNRDWWRIVVLMGLAGLLFLPWFVTAFSVFDDSARTSDRLDLAFTISEAFTRVLSNFSNGHITLTVVLLLFGLSVREAGARFVWIVLSIAVVTTLALNQWIGFLAAVRYVLVLWIPLALASGFGVYKLQQLNVQPALPLILIFSVGLWNALNPAVIEAMNLPIRYLPWREIADEVRPRAQDGDVVNFLMLIEGNDWDGAHETVSNHYFWDSPARPVFLKDVRNLSDADYYRTGLERVADAQRIWLTYDATMRPWRTGNYRDELMDADFAYCGNIVDNDVFYLDLFARAEFDYVDADLVFNDEDPASAILLRQLEPIPSVVDDTLWVNHAWQLGNNIPRQTYSVALHIVDTNNTLVTQLDYGLPDDEESCVTTVVPTATLPEGEYTAMIVVYAWQTGDRLLGWETSPDVSAERLPLGQFTIER